MNQDLRYFHFPSLELKSGLQQDVNVSYQIHGQELHTAPIVLINHALTGNSNVLSWWPTIVGPGKAIDLNHFTVLAFNIPGNGYAENEECLKDNFQKWSLYDVGIAFAKAIKKLNISQIDYAIGGSIGGGLLWEMLMQQPGLFKTMIPIAADWKATDWLIACCEVQKLILENSSRPVHTARAHAMTFYRSPESLKLKFNRNKQDDTFQVTQWLDYHGKSLKNRFTLSSYRMMNHLLMSLNAKVMENGELNQVVANAATHIVMIGIDSDGFFVAQEDRETYLALKDLLYIEYYEIKSPHGHDAFLIEHDQITKILNAIMNIQPHSKLHSDINDRF